MTGTNDNAVLDRIKENLEATINNLYGDAATTPKFEKIIFGDPANDNKLAEAGNTAYIRQADKVLVGEKRAGTISTRKKKIETREYYVIIVSAVKATPEESLRELNDLTFKTKEVIEKNVFLKKSDGTLPMASNLTVFDVPRDLSMIGKERQANNIVLRYDFPIY